ncbi:unnamed protein product [Larinioides sclopetarius]|uniref:Uncharacterized protein n=1 Tax=Larinioides sclopetarius TaxID=280406 RepID=A0AAV1ZFR6_9ARAC
MLCVTVTVFIASVILQIIKERFKSSVYSMIDGFQ